MNLQAPKWNEYQYENWLKENYNDEYCEWINSGLQDFTDVYEWVAVSYPKIEQAWHEHKRLEKFQRSNK
jgi:hypothetical protein